MNCERDNRCGYNPCGAKKRYPCKAQLDALKKDLCALENCLKSIEVAPTPGPTPRPCRCCCCCCCCCCRRRGTATGNQTTWGR